jgi:hypothetical protein
MKKRKDVQNVSAKGCGFPKSGIVSKIRIQLIRILPGLVKNPSLYYKGVGTSGRLYVSSSEWGKLCTLLPPDAYDAETVKKKFKIFTSVQSLLYF